ncbi:MAG: hypothetical protein E7358_06565 [Clostridiales bacterium]|nr:hypothetical protein [Clostridiales bacterium]
MKAFRVITVTKGKARLSVITGETIDEIRNKLCNTEEEIEIKEITKSLRLDLCEISEALRYYDIDRLAQLLVMAILENYDNVSF